MRDARGRDWSQTAAPGVISLRLGTNPQRISQDPLLIMPAPTVTPVASSIRMNEPVVRFFE